MAEPRPLRPAFHTPTSSLLAFATSLEAAALAALDAGNASDDQPLKDGFASAAHALLNAATDVRRAALEGVPK
ncbi:hypothetical protein [Hyalangium sp.]|uniref:hypothetical protein n=1 Tax=Hyalangium sp. TaxID=2028555 RepID=UPI002D74592A|nr:hypothetical protein [Hyalangium sp.]HYH96902.1 hypothetical protein [Hyalangium sp.]